MRKALDVVLILCISSFGCQLGVQANTRNSSVVTSSEDQDYSDALFTPDQLDNLLAPIALYPDPLLAQVLVASTFVDEVDEASRWLRVNNDPYAIDRMPWDVSVKAVAHYPSVLRMMSDKLDWTTSLGQAYVYQSTHVMDAIQRLRGLAYSAGNLNSNEEQEVSREGNYYRIDPYQPQYIYVPVYDPYAAYYQRGYPGRNGGSLISFGVGLAIGAWLDNDFDWGQRRVYYHGWEGEGWIRRSRPDVRITNVYVNNNYRNVQINRNVVRQNVNYENLKRYNSIHREVDYRDVAQRRNNQPNQPNRGNLGTPANQGIPRDQANRTVGGTPVSPGNPRDQANRGYPGNQGNQGNPVPPNKIIQRNVNTNDPKIDVYRGRQPVMQPPPNPQPVPQPATRPQPLPAHPEPPAPTERPAPQQPPVTRPQPIPTHPEPPARQMPTERPAPQQQPRDVARPPSPVFGGNQSGFDPRAASERGQNSRASTPQPQTRPSNPPPAKQPPPRNQPPQQQSQQPRPSGGRP